MIILVIPCFLTGCWDQKELEERAFVVIIGVDTGENRNLSLTLQVANPQVGTSDVAQSEKEPPSVIITLEIPDIPTAKELANVSITRSVTFTHVRAVIISEEFAKSDRFLPLMEYLMRDRELRREVDMIVCKEKAADFIRNNHPEMETRAHKHYELIARRWETTGLIPYTTFQRYIQRMVSNTGIFLAAYGTTAKDDENAEGKEDNFIAGEVSKYGGNPMQMIGSAVIKKGKMIGTLTGEETRLALMLRPKIRTHSFLTIYTDPLQSEYDISTRIIKQKSNEYKMKLFGGTPKIHVSVPIDVEILGVPSGMNYVTDFHNQEILEKAIKKDADDKANKLIEKTQKDFGGEPFQWAGIAKRQFATTKDFEDYNWMGTYPNMDIDVKFDVNIVDFGRLLQPYDLEKIKE